MRPGLAHINEVDVLMETIHLIVDVLHQDGEWGNDLLGVAEVTLITDWHHIYL